MSDILVCASRELMRRRSRTFANVFGYMLAVALMVVLVSVLYDSKGESDAILNNTGTHFVAFLPACAGACSSCAGQETQFENEGYVANGISTGLFPVDFVEEVRKLPTVKDAAPFLLFQFKDPGDGHLFSVGGLPPNHTIAIGNTSCAPSDIVDGRFLALNDSGKVMIEEAYARATVLKVEDTLQIRGVTFTVAGIVNAGIRPAKANIYMTFEDAEGIINRKIKSAPIEPLRSHIRGINAKESAASGAGQGERGEAAAPKQANLLLVESGNAKVQDAAIQSIRELFPSLVFSGYACYKPAAQVMGLTENAVWLLTVVIAIATVILSLKSQYSSVLERRREIGILKSIGWSDRNVVSQIVCESVLQAAAGGILGCCAAAVLMRFTPLGLRGVSPAPDHGSFVTLVFAAGFFLSLFGGVIAGVFPALFASRQQPADALRSI
jgi:putative ABC transport system permease protein